MKENFNDLFSYILNNKEWIFSGIGIPIGIFFIKKLFLNEKKENTSQIQVSADKSIQIINKNGNININK